MALPPMETTDKLISEQYHQRQHERAENSGGHGAAAEALFYTVNFADAGVLAGEGRERGAE